RVDQGAVHVEEDRSGAERLRGSAGHARKSPNRAAFTLARSSTSPAAGKSPGNVSHSSFQRGPESTLPTHPGAARPAVALPFTGCSHPVGPLVADATVPTVVESPSANSVRACCRAL